MKTASKKSPTFRPLPRPLADHVLTTVHGGTTQVESSTWSPDLKGGQDTMST